MPHLDEVSLNDYVDGVLDERARAAADEHVRACAECAEDVRALRRLLDAAATLPLSLEPPAHVWSAVRGETTERFSNRRRMLWELRVPLAAAALLMVTMASGLTWWLARGGDGLGIVGAPVASAAPAGAALGLARAEADYLEAARTLLLILEERRGRMDPAITQAIAENLRIVNSAIVDAKAALEADPSNQDVAAILNLTYQTQVQMLRRAVQLSGEI